MNVRKIEQSDRDLTTWGLLDRVLNVAGTSYTQLAQATLPFPGDRAQRFALHPWRARGHRRRRDHQ